MKQTLKSITYMLITILIALPFTNNAMKQNPSLRETIKLKEKIFLGDQGAPEFSWSAGNKYIYFDDKLISLNKKEITYKNIPFISGLNYIATFSNTLKIQKFNPITEKIIKGKKHTINIKMNPSKEATFFWSLDNKMLGLVEYNFENGYIILEDYQLNLIKNKSDLKTRIEIPLPDLAFYSIEYIPGGNYIAMQNLLSKKFTIINMKTKKQLLGTIDLGENATLYMKLIPKNRLFILDWRKPNTHSIGKILTLSPNDYKITKTIQLPKMKSSTFDIDPNGEFLIVANAITNSIDIIEMASGKTIHKLTGHTNQIKSVGFSPNGRLIASLSETELKIWTNPVKQTLFQKVKDPKPYSDIIIHTEKEEIKKTKDVDISTLKKLFKTKKQILSELTEKLENKKRFLTFIKEDLENKIFLEAKKTEILKVEVEIKKTKLDIKKLKEKIQIQKTEIKIIKKQIIK